MEATILDFTDTVVKPADMLRAVEALRRHYAGAIATESVRLSEKLCRVKPAPVPAPAPRRQRQRSLTSILRQARKAGADRVEYGGAVYHLTDNSGSPAAPAESNGNELDQWMAKHAR